MYKPGMIIAIFAHNIFYSSMSPTRASNCLTLDDYMNALRLALPAGTWSASYQSHDYEFVVASYLPFLLQVSARTGRISCRLVQEAVVEVHIGVSKAEALKFAQAMISAHSIVGKKLASCTTAKRQSPEVQALMAVMRLTKQQHPGSDDVLEPSSPVLSVPCDAPVPVALSVPCDAPVPVAHSVQSVFALLDMNETACIDLSSPPPAAAPASSSWEDIMQCAEEAARRSPTCTSTPPKHPPAPTAAPATSAAPAPSSIVPSHVTWTSLDERPAKFCRLSGADHVEEGILQVLRASPWPGSSMQVARMRSLPQRSQTSCSMFPEQRQC